MTVITTKDPILEIQRGLITNQSIRIIRGINPALASGSGELDIAPFGDLIYLGTGLSETLFIVSDSADDTLLGTGARTLFIEGLDLNGNTISETIDMDGLTNVTTVNSYNRVNDMKVLTAGLTEFNQGSITAIFTTAGTTQDQIEPLEGVSSSAHYSTAIDVKSYAFQLSFNAVSVSGPPKAVVNLKGFGRDFAIPNPAWNLLFDEELDLEMSNKLPLIPPFSELTSTTDIRLTSEVSNGTVSIRSRLAVVDIIQG